MMDDPSGYLLYWEVAKIYTTGIGAKQRRVQYHEATFGEPKHYSWTETPYGDAKEEIPEDAPEPKGKAVRSTSFVDANLLHDVITGRSCTHNCVIEISSVKISLAD